jgi:homospermidine synthase
LIKSVKTLYTGGQISRTDAVTQMSTIPLPSVEIDRYLEEWDITRKAKTKRPSRSDLRQMFLVNIIDEEEYRFELSGHGLAPNYVKWFVDQAKIDLAELARKENEAAMKEAERLLTAAFKTDLDVELAAYDVLIAQANVAIADTKLSMVEGMTVPEIDAAKRVILEYKTYIADFRRSKAELRKEYLVTKQERA